MCTPAAVVAVWRDVREAIAAVDGHTLVFLPGTAEASPLSWHSHGQARSLTDVLADAHITSIGIEAGPRTGAKVWERAFAWWDTHRHADPGHTVPSLTLGVGTASGTGIDIADWRHRLTGVAETLGLPDAALAELGILTGPPAPLTRAQAQSAAGQPTADPRRWLTAALDLAGELAAT